jgi:DNA-binding transcriptional ArsR family regulator
MADHLEVWGAGRPRLVALAGERVTIGKAAANHVALPEDPSVSRLHAVLERYGPGWCVRDLGSHNGTFVNGERVWTDRPLRPGDELRVGHSRLVLRATAPAEPTATAAAQPPPPLTRREREVLVALCRPVLAGNLFTEPAAAGQIAEALVVSEPAVRQHLLRLYDKFAIHGGGERRRLRLANEAIRRGAVSLSDLRNPTSAGLPPLGDR